MSNFTYSNLWLFFAELSSTPQDGNDAENGNDTDSGNDAENGNNAEDSGNNAESGSDTTQSLIACVVMAISVAMIPI